MKALGITSIFLILLTSSAYCQEGISSSGNLSLSASNLTGLVIKTPQNIHCEIELYTHSDDLINTEYRIWADAGSANRETRFISLIEVKLVYKGSDSRNATLEVLAPTRAPWEGSNYSIGVNLKILIPKNYYVETRTSYSNIDLVGPFSGVNIDGEYGSVTVESVKGNTIIKSSYSSIDLSDLEGSVTVEAIYSEINARDIVIKNSPGMFTTSYGKLSLEDVVGSVEAVTDYDNIRVSNINASKGSVILRTNYGQIEADNVVGELVCETSFEPIILGNIELTHGISKFGTKHAPIDAEILRMGDSQLIINNTYSTINLSLAPDISAKLLLAVDEGGKIHTKDLSIVPLVMKRNRLVGLIGDGMAKIEINIDGIGEINVSGRNTNTNSDRSSVKTESEDYDHKYTDKTSGGGESWRSYYDGIEVKFSEDHAGAKSVNIYTSSGEEIYFKIIDRDGTWESWIDNDGNYFKFDKNNNFKNWKYAKLWDSIPKEVFLKRDEFLR